MVDASGFNWRFHLIWRCLLLVAPIADHLVPIAPYSSHITKPPFGSIFLEGQLHSVTKSIRKRSLRQLDGELGTP